MYETNGKEVISCLSKIFVVNEYEIYVLIFFFQAEDGIRDIGVTGVQTCALPIFGMSGRLRSRAAPARSSSGRFRAPAAHPAKQRWPRSGVKHQLRTMMKRAPRRT